MSAWVLPDYIADVLPSEARRIEELRRALLDTARGYGYELVIPPLFEHLESLLTGAGEELDLQTFKLVDQLSGKSLGLRADMTQQVARIDAHLLNRSGVARLCYCGPVLHTRPARPHATREPLQFGAEIYGCGGVEAEIESVTLALECLRAAQVPAPSIDLADMRIVRALLAGVPAGIQALRRVHAALAAKDASELSQLTRDFPRPSREGLAMLLQLYGGMDILDEAEKVLGAFAGVRKALQDLRMVASKVKYAHVTFDLADLRGYSYYSGLRFAVYAPGVTDTLARGGRYDEVGAAYGRNRPAVGFSLDVKQLTSVVLPPALRAAIRAPWSADDQLSDAIARLRQQGETVVCMMPDVGNHVDEFDCDRELVQVDGHWIVRTL